MTNPKTVFVCLGQHASRVINVYVGIEEKQTDEK